MKMFCASVANLFLTIESNLLRSPHEQAPVVSGAECVKALGKVGFLVYRQRGSHITMVRKLPPSQTTVPNHKELDRGTLRAIIRQAGLTVDEFIGLI
jgi:predicted RNA binding protein YcfA (HicA-like mRNA interferase family)